MPSDPASDREQVERLVFECLDSSDPEAALVEIERRHADLAPRVQAALAQLQELTFANEKDNDGHLPKRVGSFELIRRLGTGGMGVVYVARDLELDRTVAVKLIRPDQLSVEETRLRFRREIAAVARLQHPGIVAIHMAGEDQGIPYYSMELIDGLSLADKLRQLRGRPFSMLSRVDLLGSSSSTEETSTHGTATSSARITGSWVETCVRIAKMVAEALEHAHERGVFHRDVKPSNVLIDAHGHARLLDFGLARLQESQELTKSTAQLGSLPYMPPEVVEGRVGEYAPAQDVYSLGVTLYELLTLESPFLGPTAGETRRRIVAARPRSPRSIHPQISWDAETVCLKAMEPDPRRRYATAGELAADLGRVLAHEPIRARPPGPLLRMRRMVQRHPAWSVGGTLGVLCFAGAMGFAIYAELHARTEADLRQNAEQTAGELARRNAEYDRLEHVVMLDNVGKSAAGLPGWPDRAETLRAWLAGTWEPFHAALPGVEAALAELAQRRDPASMQFADAADQFLYETLSQLIDDAGAFEVTEVAEIRSRLAWSERVGALTHDNPGARHSWDEARAAIRAANGVTASELYRSDPPLELSPQLGLVPIGMNPNTLLWEFYHLRSAVDSTSIPEPDPETGHVEVGDGTGIVFVLIPGGSFAMGAQAEDSDGRNFDPSARSHEQPVHQVTLAPFFLARHEMSQGQWERLGRENPSVYGPGNWQFKVAQPVTLAHPVENVDWHDCDSQVARHGLNLPTEAQWEYACRAGSATPWWTGAARMSLDGAVNIADQSVIRVRSPWPGPEEWLDDGYVVHAPVAALRPNPWGLHHTLGNVWEWCADATLLYAKVTPAEGTGLREGNRPPRSRTQRGGSCTGGAHLARCALRNPAPPTIKNGYVGMRPARPLQEHR